MEKSDTETKIEDTFGAVSTVPNGIVRVRSVGADAEFGWAVLTTIRNHPKVGRGSCTYLDECVEDRDLLDEIEDGGFDSPDEAIVWQLETEGFMWERCNEARMLGGLDPLKSPIGEEST